MPAFFDVAQTKNALWRERSVRQIVELQKRANVLLSSIGAIRASVPSYVYEVGYLEARDRQALSKDRAVGDIAPSSSTRMAASTTSPSTSAPAAPT